jgi:hypothetical protein
MSDNIVSTASVATQRGARYGNQLVSHLSRKSVGEWDDATGSGTLDMGDHAAHVTLTTTTDALVITVEAADTDIAAYEDVVGRHLERFGERDGLQVHWVRSETR